MTEWTTATAGTWGAPSRSVFLLQGARREEAVALLREFFQTYGGEQLTEEGLIQLVEQAIEHGRSSMKSRPGMPARPDDVARRFAGLDLGE